MTKSHYRVTVYLYRYPHLVFIIFLLLPLQTPITRMKFTYKLLKINLSCNKHVVHLSN